MNAERVKGLETPEQVKKFKDRKKFLARSGATLVVLGAAAFFTGDNNKLDDTKLNTTVTVAGPTVAAIGALALGEAKDMDRRDRFTAAVSKKIEEKSMQTE